MSPRVLLCDHDPALRAAAAGLVTAAGGDAHPVADGGAAVERLRGESFDLCVTGARVPGADGFAVLDAARGCEPPVPVVVVAGDAMVKDAVAALRAGAVDFLPRPFHPDVFAETLRRALGGSGASNDGPRTSDAAPLVGNHPAVRLMLERIDQVADTDANVLIRGEAGTGTDVVARLIHASSERRAGPFVRVRLAGLPDALVEAELFGAPGDGGARPGRLHEAAGGTVFLDDVSELSRRLQDRLLQSLQERAAGDVRVIASASRNLDPMVADGAFRDDLYYRLNVIPIEVPSLRSRKDDIPLLAEHFRREANAREGSHVPELPDEVLRRMIAYDWPGNVRQLEQTIEKLVQSAAGRAVTMNDLPANLRTDVVDLGVGFVDLPPYGVDLRLLLTQLEDRLIGQALQRTGGNKNRAAELLGMNRTTLVEKLRRRNVA